MIRRGVFRRFWLLLSLIVLTVQGVTPDRDDLASMSLARILRPIEFGPAMVAGDQSAPADDPAAFEAGRGDETPDEVLDPPSIRTRVVPTGPGGGTTPGRSITDPLNARRAAPPRDEAPDPSRAPASGGLPLHALCRLTC